MADHQPIRGRHRRRQRVAMRQQYPTGKNNAEDTCQRLTYTYGAVQDGSSTVGRLASVQYSVCVTGHTKAVTENYAYHPAGAVVSKVLGTTVCGTDGEGNYGCPSASLGVFHTYDTKGAVSSVAYPGQPAALVYGSDWAGRHVSLSQLTTVNYSVEPITRMLVKDGTFDIAGRLTQIKLRAGGVVHGANVIVDGEMGYFNVTADAYETETRAYNAMGQMTSLGWAANPVTDAYGGPYTNPYAFDKTISYTFPSAGSNNGQLASMSDGTGGETVVYQYDALKRLISAAATPNSGGSAAWTETYGFDGFGNLTSKVLNGSTTTIAVDGATNRLTNASYDANGNMTSGAGATLTYDEANRLKQVSPTSGGTEYYGYAPDNKRVFRVKPDGSEEWTLFGIGGEKLGTYVTNGPNATYNNQGQWTGQTAVFTAVKTNVWFDGRLVTEGGVAVYLDRLGTNRAGGARFRPYGDEISTTGNDRVKFGTYTRDSFTGLDYADQRFYASSYGRFNTVDRTWVGTDVADPSSWNRYGYVGGDPVNKNDPSGLWAPAPGPPPPPAPNPEPDPGTGGGDPCGPPVAQFRFSAMAVSGCGDDPADPGDQGSERLSLSSRGLDCIKSYESFSLKVYNDSAGNPTIGYGHLIRPGENFKAGITKEKAADLLRQDAGTAISAVLSAVTVAINQNQFDALVSFTFNVGVGGLQKSTLLANLNAGKAITEGNFTDWNMAGGTAVLGLTRRREDEYSLFSNGTSTRCPK